MTRNHDNTTYRRNSRKLSEEKLRRRKVRRASFATLAIAIAIIIAGTNLWNFYKTHFNPDTTINGVDCSWMTAKQAHEKLNMELGEKVISFVFTDDITTCTGKFFDLEASYSEIETFLVSQKVGDKQKKFYLSSFLLDTPTLLDIMEENPHFDENAMIYPQAVSYTHLTLPTILLV